MKKKPRLHPAMTLEQFDHGYWYAIELKEFARTLGVAAAAKLRKDELESAIRLYLQSGAAAAAPRRDLAPKGVKDVARGLSLDLPVVVYTNDPETKEFLEREAKKLVPGLKRRSGARYRLNRWREEQLSAGVPITYRDLVEEYARLNQSSQPFKRVPHGRYINFLADFLAKEPGATREAGIAAWHTLKTLDIEKTYDSWSRHASRRKR